MAKKPGAPNQAQVTIRSTRDSRATLDTAWAKLQRAQKHLQVTAKMIGRFARRDCGTVSKFNPKTNQFDVIANMPPPPNIIGLLVGDCVHNMRSALDHIVYEFVRSNPKRPANTPHDRTMFPIADTKEGYLRQVNNLKRLAGVPEDVAALIDALQPYHRRDRGLDYTKYPLWVLNKLENVDKHRRLMLTSAVARHAVINIRYQDGGETDLLQMQDVIHNGAVLTSYPPAHDGSEVQMNGCLFVYVALNEGSELPRFKGSEIVYLLNTILNQLVKAP